MKPKRRKIKNVLFDLGGLMPVPELLAFLGTLMMRRSMPVWGFALLVTLISWMSSLVGYKVEDDKPFSLLPIMVAASFTLLGLIFKTLPAIFAKSRLIAETSHLNLMKDYRKTLIHNHLDTLWERVYQYEADIHFDEEGLENEQRIYESTHKYLIDTLQPLYAPKGRPEHVKNLQTCVDQLMKFLPLSSKIQGTPEGFRINAIYAMEKSLPQNIQREIVGFCLGTLENYLDSAPFHESDDKLYEDGAYNMLMQNIKKEVRLTGFFIPADFFLGLYHTARETQKRVAQKIWFPLITRAIGSRVGQAIEEFNEQYGTLRFTAQEFLWPGTEDAKWIEQLKTKTGEDVRSHIIEKRKQIIFDTYGPTLEKAEEMIDRLHLFNFEIATELRMRYDIEYALGRLDQNVEDDLRMMNVDASYIQYQCNIATRSHTLIREIEYYLEKHPVQFDPRESEKRIKEHHRAILTAYYTNHNNIRSKLRSGKNHLVDAEIMTVMQRSQEYTEKIRYLRKYQTLSYLNHVNYLDHLKELAYSN